MLKIQLENNKGYSWTKVENIWVKGYCFVEDDYAENESFAELFLGKTREEVLAFARTLEGFFVVVIKYETGTLALSDRIRSFPLFYYYENNDVVLCDAIGENRIKNFRINKNTKMQLDGVSYLLWDQTLFEGVKAIEAGSYFWITDDGSVKNDVYNLFKYNDEQITNLDVAVEKLSAVYENTFKRLIKYLNGRTAVIPLSGGHDSRLVAYYLVKLGYKNIIAFSYGDPKTQDSILSKKVADTLGIKYYYMPYTRKNVRKTYKKYREEYLLYSGNGVSVPRFQTWCAVRWLKERGILNENCVVCPGYGGVLPGHYISSFFIDSDYIEKKSLLKHIEKEFFNPLHRLHPKYYEEFVKEVENREDIRNLPDKIPAKQAAEFFERWIYREDQAKGIQNAPRMYELYDIKWATPFFERAQFEIWSCIDNSLRYKNLAFKEMENRLFKGKIKEVEFTGSKEARIVKTDRNFIQKCLHIADICLRPRKHHYLNVFIPLRIHWYNNIVKRISNPMFYLQTEYFNLIEKYAKK